MTLLDAIFYFACAFWLLPHRRNDVPFKQMGFDWNQVLELSTEAGLYNASLFEGFKTVACFLDPEYSIGQGWCPQD